MNNPSQQSSETQSIELTRKSLIKALEYDDLTIPVLPKIAQDVLMMSNNPDADMDDLSRLIYQDQSIASHVLHISNSVAYGGFERIDSIDVAVARLGMKLLSEIAVSVSVKKNIFNIPRYKSEIKHMWRHSLASAIFANELARYAKMNQETLYMCGLLHEIGKPVTLFTINNLPKEIKEGLTRDNVMVLVEEFHMSVGTIVTRQWELPESIQLANLYYKDWHNTPRYRKETVITYLSDRLAKRVLREDDNEIHQILDDPAFEEVEISETCFEHLLDFKETVLERVMTMEF